MRGLLGRRRVRVVELAQAIDEREGELGLGLPGLGAQIPLGRAAVAELRDEGGELAPETTACCRQLRGNGVDALVEQGA